MQVDHHRRYERYDLHAGTSTMGTRNVPGTCNDASTDLDYFCLCVSLVVQTRLSALRACVSLLRDLSEADREHMKETVPLMFEILGTAFAQRDDETIVHAVTALTNLAELNNEDETNTGVAGGAKFLRAHIKPILSAMVTMSASSTLDAGTRRACFGFLLTLAEVGKGMIRKQNEFAQQVIPLAFNFMTELRHTADWDSPVKVSEGDDDDGFDNYKFGTEAMERLAEALGGKVFLAVATPIIERASKDQANWNVRHAALRTIAKMAMGCQKQLFPQLKVIMESDSQTHAGDATLDTAARTHPCFQRLHLTRDLSRRVCSELS
jgi:hypothetical protein